MEVETGPVVEQGVNGHMEQAGGKDWNGETSDNDNLLRGGEDDVQEHEGHQDITERTTPDSNGSETLLTEAQHDDRNDKGSAELRSSSRPADHWFM